MQDVVYHYIKVQGSFTNKQTQKAGHPMLLLQLQLQANADHEKGTPPMMRMDFSGAAMKNLSSVMSLQMLDFSLNICSC